MPWCGDILVVVSDAALSDFIAEALGDEGYLVRTCRTAASARTALALHPASLLICDLYLPNSPYPQFITELRDIGLASVPVIILADDPLAVQHLYLSGIRCCLPIPFNLDELFDCVASFSRPTFEHPAS